MERSITTFLLTVLAFGSAQNLLVPLKAKVEPIASHEAKLLSQIAVDLIDGCFAKNEPTVLLAESYNVSGAVAKNLSKTSSLVLVRNTNWSDSSRFDKIKPQKYDVENYNIRRKVNVGLVIVDETSELEELLDNLKNLTWWNSFAYFLAIESNPTRGGCREAHSLLWTMWKTGILNSYFLCYDDGEVATLRTFNPYEDFAPEPWRMVSSHAGRMGHPWILYERKYSHDEASSLCENVIFDKTRNLKGYPIRINACPYEPHLNIDPLKTGLDKFSGDDGMTFEALMATLNATIDSSRYTYDECHFGYVDENGTYQGMLADVLLKRVDIGINFRKIRYEDGVDTTYPYSWNEGCFASKSRYASGTSVKLEKLFQALLNVALIGVFFTSFMVLKFLECQNFHRSLLESVRFVLFNSMHHSLERNSSKLIMYSQFMILVVLHNMFTGLLASMLVSRSSSINIDSVKAVVDSGYHVYGLPIYSRYFEDPKMKGRYHAFDLASDCLSSMLDDAEDKVCVSECFYLMWKSLQTDKIHVGKEKLDFSLSVFLTSADWPLLKRINKVLQKMVEAGQLNQWKQHTLEKIRRQREIAKNRRAVGKKITSFTMKNLIFAFYVLIIGLLCSIIAFAFEISTPMYQRKRSKMWNFYPLRFFKSRLGN